MDEYTIGQMSKWVREKNWNNKNNKNKIIKINNF